MASTAKPDTKKASEIPAQLPVLPLRDIVIFPHMIFPVLVGRESSLRSANAAISRDKYIFLAAQTNPAVDDPAIEELHPEGTVARIIQVMKLPNGLMKILVDGVSQAIAKKYFRQNDTLEADVSLVASGAPEHDPEFDALVRHAVSLFSEYAQSNRNIPQETIASLETIQDPMRKLYYMASNLIQSVETKQRILQVYSLKEQYYELVAILKNELDVLKLEKEIDTKVQSNINRSQRRYFLQEQIRALQSELGDMEELPEIQKIKTRIEEVHMPEEVHAKAVEELDRLKTMSPLSPEATVVRNYIDWLCDVPWTTRTDDNLDIAHAKKILDEDHFGLEKPKERILEQIAVLNRVKDVKGSILCFVGPPGVGKTSLAKSIARALGRKFVRMSLGGVRDEAEIRGHRRTYIGSMPGKIIHSMKRAGVINPVILLDEVDKMSMDFRGDPSAALLEVLDPEQNNTFNDHYLDVDYDLSQTMFITTANVRFQIPLPLQDRMEIIELPGYLEHDKFEIAKRHIIPHQLLEHGLTGEDITFTDDALLKIIREYTGEAGVRNLEREIATVCRKVAKDLVFATQSGTDKKSKAKLATIDEKAVEKYLGVPKFRNRLAEKHDRVGEVLGLAWTTVGGETLPVQVTIMEGSEKLTLTGKLGDVMKESAQAALSYIRSNAEQLGVPKNFSREREIHVHMPEGAIPKDGPSAGITIAMAIISAATNKPARHDVSMTGEITLRGQILAVGGLNEKLLAARRAGVKTVILPKENEKDLPEIPPMLRKDINIVTVETIPEAMKWVFGTNGEAERKPKKR
ncbi:MAG TPA: endopeptidase La [Candidatus Kapabacteria bacterium]|nr:endopeptidase La [Candidatus Kapabacteria bacterium]